MGLWPDRGGGRYEAIGADTTASRGTAVTASGSTNTKGSYTQLVASSSFDASAIKVSLAPATSHTGYLVDIAVGGAGSETVIATNLPIYSRTGTVAVYDLPIHIPAGTRISARCQSATSAAVAHVSALLYSPPWGRAIPLSRTFTYGVSTSTSLVTTQLDPGGSANTLGSYLQLTSSTASPIKALVPALMNANGAYSDANWLIDIAVGGAGSETVVIPKLHAGASAPADIITPSTWPVFDIDIPASTRLSARAQCDITDASDRKIDIVLIGVG